MEVRNGSVVAMVVRWLLLVLLLLLLWLRLCLLSFVPSLPRAKAGGKKGRRKAP